MTALLVITVVSLAVAAVMSVVAWRLAREERLRSEERLEALAAEIAESSDEPRSPVPVNSLFGSANPISSTRGVVARAAAGICVVGVVAAVVTGLAGRSHTAGVAREAESQSAPLELTALTHQRQGASLIVRGAVRTPRDGYRAAELWAVVTVFDRAGGVVGAGRSPLDAASGVESSFAVTASGLSDIYRYRIGFSRDGRTIPHLDRRQRPVSAQVP